LSIVPQAININVIKSKTPFWGFSTL
jgi:hypothetical protein